jgi:S-adenosylmethionine decarboxylase
MSVNDIGAEWLIDATGCSTEALQDSPLLLGLCRQIISELDLHAIGEPFQHEFPPPGGITALFLLSESHLTCHTYPEFGAAAFNLYCCRPRPEWPWQARLEQALGAAQVTVRRVIRGIGSPADAESAQAGEGGMRR